MKVAGIPRSAAAPAVLALGSLAALWTGAALSLGLGVTLGAALVGTHAVFRTPNLRAKLSSYQTTDYSRP